jgi:putative transposase
VVSPAGRRAVVEHFQADFDMGERRACSLAGQSRSVQQYQSTAMPVEGLLERLVELAGERPRFGYRRLTILLRREGFLVNHKRVWRLYQDLGLAVRRRRRKRASQAPREARPLAESVNDCWSMDFLSDSMTDGRALRVFAVVDDHSKLCTTLECDISLPAQRVLRILDRAIETYGAPKRIRTDNGPEFTSRAFDRWCYERGIEHHPIRPGKPVENAYAESFNGRVRDELLNQHCFTSVRHAQDLLEDWQADYNTVRPHTALGGLAPATFLAEQAGPHGARPARSLTPDTQLQPAVATP